MRCTKKRKPYLTSEKNQSYTSNFLTFGRKEVIPENMWRKVPCLLLGDIIFSKNEYACFLAERSYPIL